VAPVPFNARGLAEPASVLYATGTLVRPQLNGVGPGNGVMVVVVMRAIFRFTTGYRDSTGTIQHAGRCRSAAGAGSQLKRSVGASGPRDRSVVAQTRRIGADDAITAASAVLAAGDVGTAAGVTGIGPLACMSTASVSCAPAGAMASGTAAVAASTGMTANKAAVVSAATCVAAVPTAAVAPARAATATVAAATTTSATTGPATARAKARPTGRCRRSAGVARGHGRPGNTDNSNKSDE
jgi:hypothetical protein